jgi:hypothetical protein
MSVGDVDLEDRRRWFGLRVDWIALATAIGSLFLAIVGFFQARDAHESALRAELNSSAQISIAPASTSGSWAFQITNEGSGPAEYVRTWCVLRGRGTDWIPLAPEVAFKPFSTTHRLTSHSDAKLTLEIRPQNQVCARASFLKPSDRFDEIYIILTYTTPWGARRVEDWDYRLAPIGVWYSVDPIRPAVLYHDRAYAALREKHIYGEPVGN